MAEPFSPYAGIEGAALTGGEGGDLLAKILAGLVQVPQRVIDATRATAPGLRRGDFTDIPGSAQPGDEQVGAAVDAAGMVMGGTAFGVPGAGGTVLGSGPIRAYHGSPHNLGAATVGSPAGGAARKFGEAVVEKYPNVKLDISPPSPGGYATLDRIVVPEAERNKGIGSAVMRDLIAEADAKGVPLALSPTADFGGSKSRLGGFYREFGFVPNSGRNKDFATRETMVRHPDPMAESQRMARAEEQGFSGPWYHGGLRMDRFTESGKVDPRRATSGPMPYFTDNPEMASSYAMGKKPDTSLVDNGRVSEYFTVDPKALGFGGRSPVEVERSWHFLPPEVKQDILSKATRVGHRDLDAAEGPLMLHPEGVNATGAGADHWKYIMEREARGNPLAALRDLWHDSGRMVDDPGQLSEVFRLAGYPHAISEKTAPWTEARGVFPARLRMTNPLDTTDAAALRDKVLPALEEAFKKDRSRTAQYGVDMWDKNHRYTPKEWVAQAKEDLAKGENSYVWTSIPDKVTEQLRRLGYDGILDTGGKMGGMGHTVAIPFGPEQVRSQFAKFDPKNLGKKDVLGALATAAPVGLLASMASREE